ncbi:GNAT family N-acetyltransferase [Streptomyces sp. NPDC057746]|uniref:GNAT family N-acetyltransferase n=1 Tax=Streptomyces sp. NPDC057746 TaxID=3346237 RepID=UPI0036CF39FC
MSMDPLVTKARVLWESLAAAPVSFAPRGGISVVASPESNLCPAGWVGVVSLDGAAVVTTPTERSAALVRDGLAALPVEAVTDADAVREVLPVAQVLGPATLSYASPDAFRSASPGALAVQQLPSDHPDLRGLEEAAGEDDAGEAGLRGITSPAFVVRAGGGVIAAAGYQTWPGGLAHVCVLTDPAWRARGLAQVTASATVAHAFAAGLLPQWRARPLASRRVASALGFQELGAQLSIKLT